MLGIFSVALGSLILTELFRRYSIKINLLDKPNQRSSHNIATPSGGGLSFVLIFLLFTIFYTSLQLEISYALIGSGILVSIIGFWNDRYHIPVKWRLLIHFIAVVWVLFWLGNIPELFVLNFIIQPGWWCLVLSAFLIVWLLNLFNFMDGIDGIAASEAIYIACSGSLYFWSQGYEALSVVSLVLASSTLGFLILNWSPAKIFMGDVGSGFLGLTIGILTYVSILNGMSIWVWGIFWAVFITDSGITLLRRIINGDKWYEAHCSHAYQHAAKKWGHSKVTLATIFINLFWLSPMAYIAFSYQKQAVLIMITAYIPLMYAAIKLKAGKTLNGESSIS